MKFNVEKKERPKKVYSSNEEFDIARKFAQQVYNEFGHFIKALILFGSVAKRKTTDKKADIDILIVLDDVSITFTRELVQMYRVIVEKILVNMPEGGRLHVQSMKFSNFWEYARSGDPVAINILRNGISLIDTGFFDPLQALLDDGRIRPSKESVHTYFVMAPANLTRAKESLLAATVSLYWAAIDSAHAALMSIGEIPPTPSHVADLLEEKLVKPKHVHKKHAYTMRELYKVFKKIVHRDIKEIKGKDYDKYRKMTEDFVDGMKKFIEKKQMGT